MKKYIFLLWLLVSITFLFSSNTGSSTAFSGSFIQRVNGSEAIYWNPANINNSLREGKFIDIRSYGFVVEKDGELITFEEDIVQLSNEILIFPGSISIENNAISLDLYNSFAGKVINDSHRKRISNGIDKSLHVNTDFNMILFGYSHQNYAFSTAMNVVARGRVDEEFIDILLYGNRITTLNDSLRRDHTFDPKYNKFGGIVYQDYSLGYGGYRMNDIYPEYLEDYPDIYGGISMSYLAGFSHVESISFKGDLFAHEVDGLYLDQQITVKESLNRFNSDEDMPSPRALGSGFKMSLGFSTDEIEIAQDQKISFGFAFDNMFGFIKWNNETRNYYYWAKIDSVLIKDLKDAIYTDGEYAENIGSYTTRLPFISRVGVKYSYQDLVASLDYAQNHGREKIYINDPEISLGLEYPIYYQWLPVRLGFRFPIGEYQESYSFGLGFHFKRFEGGFGYQSTGAFFTSKAEGFTLGAYMRVRF